MNEPNEKSEDGLLGGPAPKAIVSRLSLYLRELQHLVRDGSETTSSTQLGKLLGFTDAQVRKDLAYFGQFGYPGIGYRCAELIPAIRGILGTNQRWPVGLVGVGNLGRALLGYRGFSQQGFAMVAAFDLKSELVGTHIEGIEVFHLDSLAAVAKERGIRLGILAVPSPAAQGVAERMVEAGIEGVLNFAPVTLSLPKQVQIVGVDLAIELEQLAFAVANHAKAKS
ncbi:MAG: Redox-sensing transcriptional repressor Rex [Planctomycetota bacterium]|jgi:redox-sensing transcriptional repressor